MRLRGIPIRSLGKLLRPAFRAPTGREQHLFLCVADHYEPKWNRPAKVVEHERVARWIRDYPRMAAGLADSRGRSPQHTFFYPQDEYEAELVEPIAELCRQGHGDVEVHLHHDGDTAEGFRAKLLGFTQALHVNHGMLRRDAEGRLAYAFIHGNWALNNSRPDGRWCGVDDETSILLETGCYADMTMPSAPSECQIVKVNEIYYARPDRTRRCGHDRGDRAAVGRSPANDSLLMIQGPLGLDWQSRKWGMLPRIENGDLTGRRPPTIDRLRLWLQAGVSVAGRPEWTFVKLHTHGAQERNADMLLGEPMRAFHQALARFANEHDWLHYYYVTASEMARLVHAAEAGATDPTVVLDQSARTASAVSTTDSLTAS